MIPWGKNKQIRNLDSSSSHLARPLEACWLYENDYKGEGLFSIKIILGSVMVNSDGRFDRTWNHH